VQKNYNLLAGLKEAGDPDVYVFADADIKPEPGWLRELVLPLADDKVAVTTGFRWLHARKGTLGELTHSYVNIFIYVLFTVACFFGGVGLWGGSMAIRRKDFDELGVGGKWALAGVDDMSLSQLVYKARRKAVLVPPCVVQTDDLIQTVGGTVNWFERQIMYLKAYQKNLWFFLVFPVASLALLMFLLLPFAVIAAFIPGHTFFGAGGGAALLFYIGELFTVLFYPLLGKMYSFPKFILFWPILRFTHIISYALTFTTNTIIWAGIKYKLTFSGDVAEIDRLKDSA
jgi:cellulose synthase/poly-beta-1,6-N-acetylglucosamine synthase-like glycosyltransferase